MLTITDAIKYAVYKDSTRVRTDGWKGWVSRVEPGPALLEVDVMFWLTRV
jgi:hypothetical protein